MYPLVTLLSGIYPLPAMHSLLVTLYVMEYLYLQICLVNIKHSLCRNCLTNLVGSLEVNPLAVKLFDNQLCMHTFPPLPLLLSHERLNGVCIAAATMQMQLLQLQCRTDFQILL